MLDPKQELSKSKLGSSLSILVSQSALEALGNWSRHLELHSELHSIKVYKLITL